MNFPALIQFDGDDELEILRSNSDYVRFLDEVQLDCALIDNSGALYNIRKMPDGIFAANESATTLSTDDAVVIAQRHLATLDQCCIAKFTVSTVSEVVATLAALDD